MLEILQNFITTHYDLLVYLAIPIISGIVGWGTNILAIHMTFYPLEFVGIKPIGWQGIIPMKAGIMAGKSVDLLTESLINIEEQFSQIKPEIVAKEVRPVLKRLSAEIMDDVMRQEMPLLWAATPKLIKKQVYNQTGNGMPEVVSAMMQEVKVNINELFDLKEMVVSALVQDKELLNQIFLQCGAEEFKFIKRSGFYFGFLFGIFQMLIWYLYPADWILPVAGLLVGYLTNFLALKLIFEPLEPKKIGPFTLQGLFIKRQADVSKEYSKMIADRIMTSSKIFDSILEGKTSRPKLEAIVAKHVSNAVDMSAGILKPFYRLARGDFRFTEIKEYAVARFMLELPGSIRHMLGYAEEALDIENTMAEKMNALPPSEYVGVLRPAFQEDEWKLILTGAILGGIAGVLQLVLLF